MSNKKSMNSYLKMVLYKICLIIICSFLGVAITLSRSQIIGFFEAIINFIKDFTSVILWIMAIVEVFIISINHLRLKKMIRIEKQNVDQDAEDDSLSYQIDKIGTFTSAITYGLFMLSFLFFIQYKTDSDALTFFKIFAPFLVISAGLLVYNIAYVKQAQLRDPSKKGDPAGLSFQKEWMESCDEAEKEINYQSSYRTLQLLNLLLPLMLIIAMWGEIMFHTGFLAAVLIIILWGTTVISKMLYHLKLIKSKLNH